MLSTNRLRNIYSKIQTQLFYMIPEKWDRIYLYASIIEQVNHLETGEMFFYYYPAGLLKKKPVNVYEIPNKFNIEEEEYMKLVDKLYSTLNELRQAFKESTEEKMWTNLTITIADLMFNIEYNYEDLIGSKFSSYDRHLIWQCKYLNYPLERLTKKDRKMVEMFNSQMQNSETKTYTEGMYKKKVHNIIEYRNYNQENNNDEIQEHHDEQENEEKIRINERASYKIVSNKPFNNIKNKVDKKIDKYELYKQEKEKEKEEKENIEENIKNQVNNKNDTLKKNQILNV